MRPDRWPTITVSRPAPQWAASTWGPYQYAALLARAELADAFGEPETAARLRERADVLQARFLDAFWLPEQGWYAIALDGRKRPSTR